MDPDGEEGCEGNESSLIAYLRLPDRHVGSRDAGSGGVASASLLLRTGHMEPRRKIAGLPFI